MEKMATDTVQDSWLGNNISEKDLGVVKVNKLNMSQQCETSVKRRKEFWATFKKSIASKSSEVFISCHLALM